MRFNLHAFSFSAALVAATLVPSFAQAEVKPYPSCDRDPTESDVSAAKGAYEAGQVSFQEADYDRALLYWEDAFRRDCTAVKLLLNIARAYELSGDLEHAVNSLQTYVDRRPDAKDRSSVEKRIEKLKERVEKQKSEEAEAAVVSEEPAEAEPAPDETEPAPAQAAPATYTKKPAWPVIMTGGGVLVALIGHGMVSAGEEARSDKAEELGCDLDAGTCPEPEAGEADPAEIVNAEGQSQRQAGAGVALAGHLIGITGGVLWWYLWSKEYTGESAMKDTMFQPVVAPGYGGLSFSGRF